MTNDGEGDPDGSRRPGRRDVLVLGAGVVVGAAVVGTGWLATTAGDDPKPKAEPDEPQPADDEAPPPELLRFQSTELTAPKATAWRKPGAALAAGLLFTTPRTPTFRGVVYDDAGEPVWIEPDGNAATELRVQRYRGRPVLTYWTGEIKEGMGNGKGVILDERYLPVAEVRAGNGVLADLHEFQLTERGTALLTSYPTMPWDLTAVDGPADGWIWGGRIQEVDVATGEVLLDWEAMDHIELTDTHRSLDDTGADPAKPFDPVHVNSVAEDGDALLVSARHTSTVYRIDRRTGEVLWRFGGKGSDFPVPPGGEFGWQHDARRQPDGTITIYDNHENAIETDAVSAALQFRIDERAGTAELVRALRHEDRYGYAMGNAQWLPDDHVLVGWGMDPYATEFDGSGEVVFELGGLGQGSYRSYRHPWRGRPATAPAVAVVDGRVHMSWNGATEVARWRVLTGRRRGALREYAVVDRTGFETSAPLDARGLVAVEALDADGRVLGRAQADA